MNEARRGREHPPRSGRGGGGNRYSRLLVRLPTPPARGECYLRTRERCPPPSRSTLRRARRRQRRQLQSRESEDTRHPRSSDRADISEFFRVQRESVRVVRQPKENSLVDHSDEMSSYEPYENSPTDIFNRPCVSFLSLIPAFP